MIYGYIDKIESAYRKLIKSAVKILDVQLLVIPCIKKPTDKSFKLPVL